MFKKTIISEFFTTLSFHQAIKSLYLITFGLWKIVKWEDTSFLEYEMKMYVWKESSKVLSFYNARSALYHSLKIIGIEKNDEVIVSAYTCVSVVNAVIQSGAKIVYCDIEKQTLWLDHKDLKKKITKNTKAVIIQHTFWIPSNIEAFEKIIEREKIVIIEDCAHSLWTRKENKKLWYFWDFSFFSTGRDKVISSVSGWILLINNNNFFEAAEKLQKNQKHQKTSLVCKDLLYNIFAYLSYKFYDVFSLWKGIIFFARKTKLINEIITQQEKNCDYKLGNIAFPNALAILASEQLKSIKITSYHRRCIAEFYEKNIQNPHIEMVYKNHEEKQNCFRFPILLESKETKELFYRYMKNNKVLLWNFRSGDNIVPQDIYKKNTLYVEGSCKQSEDVANSILTLPNHTLISLKDAQRVVELINKFKK